MIINTCSFLFRLNTVQVYLDNHYVEDGAEMWQTEDTGRSGVSSFCLFMYYCFTPSVQTPEEWLGSSTLWTRPGPPCLLTASQNIRASHMSCFCPKMTSFLCSSFYQYVRRGSFFNNKPFSHVSFVSLACMCLFEMSQKTFICVVWQNYLLKNYFICLFTIYLYSAFNFIYTVYRHSENIYSITI